MPRTLDHVVLCVSGLEQARESYRALGFSLTPPATHPFGTRNSLVQLPGRNFLELLALDENSEVPPHEHPHRFSFGAHNRDFLRRRGEGMSMLALAGSDAWADVEEFGRSGLVTYEPFDFGRQATLPDGQVAQLAFSLAFVTHPGLPDLAFFTSQQRHAPELFWKPEYQQHANGAERLVEVVMAAPEPAALGDFFARLTGGPVAADDDGGGLRVGPPTDRISVLTPRGLRERFPELDGADREDVPSFAGYRVAVADVSVVRRTLERGGVPHRATAGMVVVPPSAAHKVAVEFTE